MTQEKLAAGAQIERTYPSKLEQGDRTPTISVIVRIAGALGISAGQLVDLAVAEYKQLDRLRGSDK